MKSRLNRDACSGTPKYAKGFPFGSVYVYTVASAEILFITWNEMVEFFMPP